MHLTSKTLIWRTGTKLCPKGVEAGLQSQDNLKKHGKERKSLNKTIRKKLGKERGLFNLKAGRRKRITGPHRDRIAGTSCGKGDRIQKLKTNTKQKGWMWAFKELCQKIKEPLTELRTDKGSVC